MKRLALLGVWAGSIVVAFYLGAQVRDDAPAPAAIASRPSITVATPRCTVDESTIRRAVADAVTAKPAPSTPAAEARVDTPDDQEPVFDPEVATRAYQRGSEILDQALARGAWSGDDAANLRLVILQLPKEPRHALLDRLFGAVNANQLRNDAPGAPI